MPSRKLEIEIVGDNSSLSRALRASARDSDTLGSRLSHAAKTGAIALGTGLVAAAGAAAYGIAKSAEAAEESNKVHAQTEAVLKSTGHAANVTQQDVEGLSGAISRKTGIDDEQVQSGANLLLTFTNIRNEVGKGNDVFDQSTHTIVDMSAALDQDLKSSAIQVGKALNDPIKGLTALQRVGVSFSEQKAEQIKQWVEEGHTLRAQKAILSELNKEFGGSAAAQATAMDKIKVSVGNVEESIGNVFLPLIEEGANKLNRDFIPELQHTADGLARIAARKDIDLDEKLKLSKNFVEREFGDVPQEIGHLLDEAVPVVAEHAGHLGVAWAKGMLDGFIHSDPLGKAAILLFASKALGGPAAVGGLVSAGKRAGSVFGGAAATESATAMAALGLGSRASKSFGLVERMRSIGGTIGKLGLGLGIMEGASAAFEDPASSLGARLEQLQQHGSGLIGSLEHVPGLSLVNHLGDSWAEQGDKAKRLEEILRSINTTYGHQHRLLEQEARSLADQLGLTRQQRGEVEKTLQAQTIARQNLNQGLGGLEGGKFTRLSDIKEVMQRDAQAIATSTERGSQRARDAMSRNYQAAAIAVEKGMDRGVIKTKTGMAEIERLTRQAHLVSGDDPWGIAQGFSRTWDKAGTITSRQLDNITRDLGKMPPASAQITGQMMLEIARQMRSKGQLSKAEVEKLRSAVVTKLSNMASQGGVKGGLFASNVGGAFGVLSTEVAEALENIGVNVSTVLKELGAHNPDLQFTLQYFKAHGGGSGGKYLNQVPEIGKAAGGAITRVPGQGLFDSVPLAVNGALSAVVAPDEDLVVFNRHQRPLVDRAVANEYGVDGLPGFFGAFDRPHYMARGGLHEPKLRGPDPLRGLGQAGIHKGFQAAQAYLKAHRPKGGIGGPTGAAPPGFAALYEAWQPNHPQWDVWQTGLLLQEMGFEVAENPHFGGVHPVHTSGSYHYLGRAIDFNWPGGGGVELSHLRSVEPGLSKLHPKDPLIEDAGGSNQHGHFAFNDGGIVSGRATWFNGGSTAGGWNTSQPGLALNLHPGTDAGWDNETTRRWMELAQAGHPVYGKTTIGGKTANLPITDLGPAGWTGNAIDVTEGGVRKLGFTTDNFPSGSTGRVEILGEGTGSSSGREHAPPASKQQRRTIHSLQARAQALLQDIKGLEHQYKKHGGTPRGRRALHRAERFAEEAAEEAKAGNREHAQELISDARDEIGKARDSYEKAQENVYTPGLKPSAMPSPAASGFDPSKPYSPGNLPGVGALPPEIAAALTSPGLDFGGKHDAVEAALTMAGLTSTEEDDAAALNLLLGMDRERRKRLKAELHKENKALRKGGLTKKQREALLERRNQTLAALGEAAGNISSDRERIKGLNEGSSPADRADLQLARAELTPGKEDDLEALQHLKDLAEKELKRAEESGDPREIAEATRNLKSAADALREAVPTAQDFASRDLALAELTESTEDDKAALERLLAIAEEELAAALATADPRDDIEAAHNVKQMRDSLKALEEQASNTELAQEVKSLREELEKNRKLSESEAAVSAAVARRALADMISGELGPRIFHSSQTAGAGTIGTL